MIFKKKITWNTLVKLICIVLISILCVSCNDMQAYNPIQRSSVKNSLTILVSNDANGRLPGTEGNKLVEEYIKNTFESIGLDTYNGSYLFQYTHKGWKPLEEDYKMTIKFSDGEVLQCKYGEDFLENNMMNIDLKAQLTLDYNDKDIHNKIVLLEDSKYIAEEEVKSAKAILVPRSSFRRSVPKFEGSQLYIVQISDRLNNLIQEKKVDEIDINFQVNAVLEEFPQNNVVGVIPGENRKNAIIITAHYDHVGNNGEMIWKGAIDNGTGTSTLIDIAEKLKKYSEKETLKQDIAFCAFNGEESAFQGSIPFVKNIQEKYDNLYNINIDCVGIKDGGKLLIDGEEESNNDLVKFINEHFQNDGFETTTDKDLVVRGSDHSQFISAGINAIGLSQEGLNGLIHTLEDNIDKVDIKYIEKLSTSIVDFVIKNSEKTFDIPIEGQFSREKSYESNKLLGVDEETRAKDERRLSELEKLDFNQYKYIEVNGATMLVRKNSEVFRGPYYENEINMTSEDKKLEDFYKIYPKIPVVEELGEYKLAEVTIVDNSEDYIENPDIDKIYTIEPKLENLGQIDFRFSRNETKNKNQTYHQSICITFIISDKADNIYDNYYNNISNTEIKIDKEVYYSVHRKENNNLNGLYKKVEVKDKLYNIMISPYYGEDWQYEAIDEIVLAYRELDIAEFIQNIMATLSTNNK